MAQRFSLTGGRWWVAVAIRVHRSLPPACIGVGLRAHRDQATRAAVRMAAALAVVAALAGCALHHERASAPADASPAVADAGAAPADAGAAPAVDAGAEDARIATDAGATAPVPVCSPEHLDDPATEPGDVACSRLLNAAWPTADHYGCELPSCPWAEDAAVPFLVAVSCAGNVARAGDCAELAAWVASCDCEGAE